MNSHRPADNLRHVDRLIAASTVLEVRLSTTDAYARLRLDLKRKGRPIPENVVWIAALCVEHNLPLATEDQHFAAVDGLRVIPR